MLFPWKLIAWVDSGINSASLRLTWTLSSFNFCVGQYSSSTCMIIIPVNVHLQERRKICFCFNWNCFRTGGRSHGRLKYLFKHYFLHEEGAWEGTWDIHVNVPLNKNLTITFTEYFQQQKWRETIGRWWLFFGRWWLRPMLRDCFNALTFIFNASLRSARRLEKES